MKNIKKLFINDIQRFVEYRILHLFLAIIFLFTAAMALFPSMNPMNFIYVSIFILPVVLFSISMYIEREEGTLIPLLNTSCKCSTVLISKILSAMSLQLIPIILYSLVFRFVHQFDISYFAFILTYLLGSLVHIVIGLSLSIISKSNTILSFSYVAYIIIFTLPPIFYENGMIPLSFQYVLMISPAYMSGVLLGNILVGTMYSSLLMILLSIFLQFVYLGVLIYIVTLPFLKAHLLQTTKK